MLFVAVAGTMVIAPGSPVSKKMYYKKCQCSGNLQPVFSGATCESDQGSRSILGH